MTDNTNVTNDVFTTQPVSTDATVTSTEPNLTGTVAELVGEGKKYKTLEALAASVIYKDEHIAKIEAENKAIREEKEKLKTDEVFNKLLNTEPSSPKTNGLTQEDVAKLISETLEVTERQKVEASNINSVKNTLVNHLGDEAKAQDFVINKAKELGLSVSFLMNIAAKNPTAFLNTINFSTNNNTATNKIVTNSVNNINNISNGVKVGSEEYFTNIYKTDKKKYFSPTIQKEIQEAVVKGIYFKQ